MTHYSSDIIKKYAAPVPRYTSYPTAPHFNENVGAQQYEKWLEAMEAGTPVSLYIHIPFLRPLMLVLWLSHKTHAQI